MGRVWLLAVLVYGYGHPGFDGHRPDALDRPLKGFHRAIDITASDARRALVAFDDKARSIPVLVGGLRRLNDAF
jgi:hypothetical protein